MHIVMIGPRKVLPHPEAGLDRYVWELSNYLASQGDTVTIYCHRSPQAVPDPIPKGIVLKEIATPSLHHLDTFIYGFFATCRTLREKAEVIHYHGGVSIFSWIARLFGKKIAVTIHSQEWTLSRTPWWLRPLYFLGEWIGCKTAHGLSAVSKDLSVRLELRMRKKVTPLWIGMKTASGSDAETPAPFGLQKKNYLLFLGRVEKGKGLEFLLAAFASFKNEMEAKLVIAGEPLYDKNYLEALKRQAPANVLFVGRVEGREKEGLLTQALLYIQASEKEGLSLSLVEAMGRGLPVLVSDIPQNRETCGSCGVFFQPENAQDFKDKLLSLVGNAARLKAVGEEGRKLFLEKYSWENQGKAFLKFYEGIVFHGVK